jgi:hypothetical protein
VVLFEHRDTTHAIGAQCGGEVPRNASEQCAEISSADYARLFDFESELEATLTYIPLAVRFKLDKCGIKLSLEAWQLLHWREPCGRSVSCATGWNYQGARAESIGGWVPPYGSRDSRSSRPCLPTVSGRFGSLMVENALFEHHGIVGALVLVASYDLRE